ncbi:MAG: hypothetical protein M1541_08025 [Acidobacteria bacterium]|nr:hypothetical protein [Acidobacteriota bacterium]
MSLHTACGLLLLLAGALPGAAGAPARLSLVNSPAGLEILKLQSASPDAKGVIYRYVLELPDHEAGSYWSVPGSRERWYDGANQMRLQAFHNFQELPEGGLFLLLMLKSGGYLAALPLTGSSTMSWIKPESGHLVLNIGDLGSATVKGPFPALAWARAADPYTACREVWARVMRTEPFAGHIKPRSQKTLPEFLHYLGYATWEEYRQDYDAQKLVGMMDRIHRSGVPIRWIQIGMGHHDGKGLQKGTALHSFEPDPRKFPEGWNPVMAARRENGIKWLGLFQALSGMPGGIHPDNALGALNRFLAPVPSGALQPRDDAASASAFYDAMLDAVNQHGFEFIKMDFETPNLALLMGTPNPVEAAVNNQRAYQAAAEKHLHGTINCMAHYGPGIFNTANSAMTRVAQDYKKGDAANARQILHNSYGNLPWAGQTVWGDHDMFHSSDTVSSKMMAVAKAVSGGTVYLSDRVDSFVKELITPLCYKDGRILRPLAPAAPLPESLFVKQVVEPFRVIAPLPNNAAAVVIYNLSDPVRAVEGSVSAMDYGDASVMTQPYTGRWAQPKEGLVLYDWREHKAERLTGTRRFSMPGFEDRFLLLCPIQEGWAVIGRTDKYLSPAAVEVVTRTRDELVLRMIESGPVAVWTAGGGVVSKEARFQDAGGGLWTAEVPAGKDGFTLHIQRGGLNK